MLTRRGSLSYFKDFGRPNGNAVVIVTDVEAGENPKDTIRDPEKARL